MFVGVFIISLLANLSSTLSDRTGRRSVSSNKTKAHTSQKQYGKQVSYLKYVNKNRRVKLSLVTNRREMLRYVIGQGFRVTATDNSPDNTDTESSIVVINPLDHGRDEIIVNRVWMCLKATGDERISNCDDDRRNVNVDRGWTMEMLGERSAILTNDDEDGQRLCLTKISGGKIGMKECRSPHYDDQKFEISHYTAGADAKNDDDDDDGYKVAEEGRNGKSADRDSQNGGAEEKGMEQHGPPSDNAYEHGPKKASFRSHVSDLDQPNDYRSSEIDPDEPKNLNPKARHVYSLLKDVKKKTDEKMKEILKNPNAVDADKIISDLLALNDTGMAPGCRYERVMRCSTDRSND